MRKSFLLIAVVLLASCQAQGPRLPEMLSPYRIDIQQGNVVTQDMVAKLKAGLTRSQVRFILGSPLVVDMFHADRWDYIYLLQRQNRPDERRRLTVIFDGDKLVTIEGDVVLSDRDLEPAARHPDSIPAPKPEAAKPAVKPESVKPAPKPEPVAPAPKPVAPAPKPAAVTPAPKPEPVAPVVKPVPAAPAAKPAEPPVEVSPPAPEPPTSAPGSGTAKPSPSSPAASGGAAPKTDPVNSDAAKPDDTKSGTDNKSGGQRMLDKIGF